MAIVTSSFNTTGLQAANNAFLKSWGTDKAVSWGVAAYNNAVQYAFGGDLIVNSTSISSTLKNGDKIVISGINMTTTTPTIYEIDYTFVSQGITASLMGDIRMSSNGTAQIGSGYINKLIVSSAANGSITINGYDDISSTGPLTIYNSTVNYNGVQLSAVGPVSATTSIINGYYATTLSGALTSMSMNYSEQSLQANQINVPVNTPITSLENLFSYALSGKDTISGSAQNDVLKGFGGNDTIDGGAGTDIAVFSSNRVNYTLTKAGNTITTSAVSGTDGVDTLINIERLQFTDKSVAFDLNGNAGQAYRLYQAAFDRKPDMLGLGYWIDAMDKGATLTQVAAGFFQSSEFQKLYGFNPNTSTLVTNFYQNVLHRLPDQGGFNYWSNLLNSGAITPASTLANFCESPENQAAVIGSIQNGIEFTQWLG
ncbi:DUF4214 domain-containing protein [Undibacterium sp. SXout7W]|uniref:DUF4214 domain-containing protein n=1 Tax=Undibacterium sp. SXout7W TaxID=3413049 RepID=UPI003BF29215